jgi:hypothetical protein
VWGGYVVYEWERGRSKSTSPSEMIFSPLLTIAIVFHWQLDFFIDSWTVCDSTDRWKQQTYFKSEN